jgi:hypothetical protein
MDRFTEFAGIRSAYIGDGRGASGWLIAAVADGSAYRRREAASRVGDLASRPSAAQ